MIFQLINFLSFMKISFYLFAVVRRFQHCPGHITMGNFVGRGNQYIQFIKVLYCKLLTIDKQLPTFPHKVWGLNHQPRRWETNVLPLPYHGPQCYGNKKSDKYLTRRPHCFTDLQAMYKCKKILQLSGLISGSIHFMF